MEPRVADFVRGPGFDPEVSSVRGLPQDMSRTPNASRMGAFTEISCGGGPNNEPEHTTSVRAPGPWVPERGCERIWIPSRPERERLHRSSKP